jgi:Rieske Fe-S protein
VTRPGVVLEAVRRNFRTAVAATAGLVRAETTAVSPALPERTGAVGRSGLDPRPVGVVSAGCAVRATCTHLGGTLRWNDAERSWDCPLHGSRFSEDGGVLEGPAVRDLETVHPNSS